MAQYDVTYSCGHSGTVNLTGPTKQRESKLEWYRWNAKCPDCYAAQKQAEREAQNARAAEHAQAEGLPPLAGSERQIAWATTIRQGALARVQRLVHPNIPEPERGQIVDAFRGWMVSHLDAKWWIDRRGSLEADGLATLYRDGKITGLGAKPLLVLPEEVRQQIRALAEVARDKLSRTMPGVAEIMAEDAGL